MEIGFAVAFVAGLLTFFATCLIPVLPAYIAYLGGSVMKLETEQKRPFYQRPVFINSLIFSLGFLLIFMFLGLAAAGFGSSLARHRPLLEKFGGVFLILMGVYLTELIKVQSFFKSWQFKPKQSLRATKWGAFLFGLSFGFAWTPCIGPVLATILFFAGQSESQAFGIILLLTFGLGLAVPFILAGFLFQAWQPLLTKLGRASHILKIIFGLLVISTGILMLTGHLGLLTSWALRWGSAPVLNFGA